jgi:dihydrodipicolinate synthase/N-acetylneuraminate lyase
MTQVFRGVGVALVTIFTADGAVDPGATGKLAADLVARGMRSVLVAGSTGEAPTLEPAERRALIEAVRETVPADVPVIAGTGAPSIRQAAALTSDAVRSGADAVLAWPPLRAAGGQPGYFGAVAEAAEGRPVLAYNFPQLLPPGVPMDVLASLPVAGVKDSSGDPDRLLDELAHYDGATYVGSSALLALAGPMGGAGALLALANIEPERCVAAFGGDAQAQRGLAGRHLTAKREGPAALKRVLADAHGLSPVMRAG